MLNRLESENLQKFYQLHYDIHCHSLDYQSGQPTFNHHWKEATNYLNKLKYTIFPWYALEEQKQRKSAEEQWQAIYGQVHDSKTQEKIQATIEQLQQMKAKDQACKIRN